jgi:hypothetical protein
MATRKDLPEYDGQTAFGGALRFLPADSSDWTQQWFSAFAKLKPPLKFFATDAFSTLFGYDSNGSVVIFLPETAEIDALGVPEDAFLDLILADPDATIHFELFKQAVKQFGKLLPDETFALKIETALGGQLDLENLYKMQQMTYLIALGKIAQQLSGMNPGDRITSVDREND